MFQIIYSEPAQRDLDQLPQKHAAQIVKTIARLELGLFGDIKRLQHLQRIKNRKEAYD